MGGAKKENASVQTNPPGGEPCRLAHPGLFSIVDFQKREFVIPQEIVESYGLVIRTGKILRFVRWKKP